VIGFCEIENRFVLNKLIYETPLKSFDYEIIHADSPDRRGIDVAFLYRQSRFEPLYYYPIPIHFPDNPGSKTRDILYVKGILNKADTVHFFVNHWPSRYGGYEDSKPRRLFVASVLRNIVDSILSVNHHPNIIIMGDFNDEPWDESIRDVLKAKTDTTSLNADEMIALMGLFKKNMSIGTNKFQAEWSVIDQFIVSGNLLSGGSSLRVSNQGAKIYDKSFLLEKDETHLGMKLNRTFVGPVYHGGFSDHLPVYLDLIHTANHSGK
jgi:exonuclease III